MPALNKFYCFSENLAEKAHNLGSDTLKVALSNVAPDPADEMLSDITQIAAVNGYTAGGATAAVSSSAQTAGAYKLILGDVAFTATGGDMGPFRYVVLYNSTPANKNLIGWADYGLSYTLPSGQTFTIDFDGVTGAITIA